MPREKASAHLKIFFKGLKAPYQKPPPSFLRSFLLPTPEIHLGKKKKKICTYLQNKKRLPAKIAPNAGVIKKESAACGELLHHQLLTPPPTPPPLCRCSRTSRKIMRCARLLQMQAVHSPTKVTMVISEADLSPEFRFHLCVRVYVCVCECVYVCVRACTCVFFYPWLSIFAL